MFSVLGERMSGGGSSGSTLWKWMMGLGAAVVVATMAAEHAHLLPVLASALLLAVGGLSLIFGSCEAMILGVEGLGGRLRWNPYVAGTIAGLASEIPEVIMIGFVVAKDPRVAFVVTVLSLHVNALVFGAYSGLLKKDEFGQAELPKAIVELGADMLSCAAGLVLAVGMLMLTLKLFDAGDHRGEGLGVADLYMTGACLLTVQVVFVFQMLRHFAGSEEGGAEHAPDPAPVRSWGWVAFHGLLGVGGAFLGGHAVGDFADELVRHLTAHGYSEMIGAIVVSLFSGVAGFLMIGSAHAKGKQDIALSNVAGGVTAVPFVVLPFTLIIMGVLAQLGVIPHLPHGGVLPIDFDTTGVLLFAFPTLLVLWKSIADDGKISHMETTIMVVLFALIIYFLAQHG